MSLNFTINITTDWQGNQIFDGATLLVVRIKPTIIYDISGVEHAAKYYNKHNMSILQSAPLKEYYWDVIAEGKVFVYNENSIYLEIGELYAALLLVVSDDERGTKPHDIVCIKGLSDNEEAFYLEYFKVK